MYCDNSYSSNKINNEVMFMPYRIIGFNIKTVFDTLFSQTSIVLEIINKLKPKKIYLVSDYSRKINKQINYFEHGRGNYCESLFDEIFKYLSIIKNYDYELISIPRTISHTLHSIKGTVKESIRNHKYFNIYRQHQLNNIISDCDIKPFETIVKRKNLFMNQGWGINRLIKYSLLSNYETLLLINKYIFIYRGFKIYKHFPLIIDNTIQPTISPQDIEKHVAYFNDFIKQSLHISLQKLIHNRITFFNREIFPILFYGCRTLDKFLKNYRVDNLIGNMKSCISKNFNSRISLHILPYLTTYDSRYECLYFTHGYDPYSIDRTFLELPCNFYFTLNQEYKKYFIKSFRNQTVHSIPKVDVIEL